MLAQHSAARRLPLWKRRLVRSDLGQQPARIGIGPLALANPPELSATFSVRPAVDLSSLRYLLFVRAMLRQLWCCALRRTSAELSQVPLEPMTCPRSIKVEG